MASASSRAMARCTDCDAVYPVEEGIGVFLTQDLQRTDLWEAVDSELARYLQAHPAVQRRLLEDPLHTLSPADRFFRAMALEEAR